MNRERWEQLKPLFHGALEQPPSERAAWLRQACPDDDALRTEAQALIDAHQTSGRFLERPASLDPSADDVPLEIGAKVGPYVVRGELGRGGMGIVYLAEDLRLGRTVALKALPSALARDAQRRERLRREARAAASLTHPGIATVYALEEIDGELFIAAEHVKGRTLKAEIAEGALSPERSIATAIEIVRALCAAHEAGIVHRDLKPENILRTGEGGIKILDFGIAQFTDATLTHLTIAGAVLGTPAYMAPEQLAGGDVDFRADLYAVGILIAEMTTGVHPFATGSIPRVPMPDAIKAIADRCLAQMPRDRYGTTRELLAALETAQSAPALRDSVDQRGKDTSSVSSPRWWWEFHQAVAALVYWLMAIPVWSARGLIGGAGGRALFIVTLAAIIVSANLRLHRWFTSRFYPDELHWVRLRTRSWIYAADWVFVASLAGAGLLVGDDRAALATLLLAMGIGIAVVFLFVEPVTERAAFK
jgi:serine/threonine protein kinase